MGNFGSGVSAFVQTSQSNLLREDEIKYDLESKQYAQMLSDNQIKPGTWNENLLKAKEQELDATKRILEVGKQAVADSSLVQGANALRDSSSALTQSGARDIANAKKGTGLLGGLLIDSAAEITQDVELAILNYLTGGLASAITNVASKKLMNVATPFRYAFGPGILDEAVSELVGRLGDTKTGRIVLSALSEGGEALAQSIVLPVLQRATYDPMAAFDLGDTMYQTTIGTITGAFGGGFDALTHSDPFLAGFYGDDLAEIQDTITAENLIQSIQEYTAQPVLSAQNLEIELQQLKPDRNPDPVFEFRDLNKLLEDSLSDFEKSHPFVPENAKASLLKLLDSSSSSEDNIAMLRYYAENTDFIITPNLPCPVAYDPDNDFIRYNPDQSLPGGVDIEGVLAHELAHRSDLLIYDIKNNLQWRSAIESLTQSLSPRGSELKSLLWENEKYNDPYLSDIMSAIFRGTIDFPYGHDEDYWTEPNRREQEIFANICAIDTIYSLETQEFYSLLAPLYSIWKTIMKG